MSGEVAEPAWNAEFAHVHGSQIVICIIDSRLRDLDGAEVDDEVEGLVKDGQLVDAIGHTGDLESTVWVAASQVDQIIVSANVCYGDIGPIDRIPQDERVNRWCPFQGGHDPALDSTVARLAMPGIGGLSHETDPYSRLLEPFARAVAFVVFEQPGIDDMSAFDGSRLNPVIGAVSRRQSQDFVLASGKHFDDDVAVGIGDTFASRVGDRYGIAGAVKNGFAVGVPLIFGTDRIAVPVHRDRTRCIFDENAETRNAFLSRYVILTVDRHVVFEYMDAHFGKGQRLGDQVDDHGTAVLGNAHMGAA